MSRRPLLELRNARVVRDGATILDIDRLVLYEGEHVAVLGPNGSGKSTLIGVLTRDIRPLYRDDYPPVKFFGKDRWDLFEARALFGVVSAEWQSRYVVPVTVEDVVVSGFFGSVGLHPSRPAEERHFERARELMVELGIERLAGRRMDTLSTGEARRALIARALVDDPPVLVLDEPCAGLDPGAAYHLRTTYGALAGAGRSLVLVTHHIEDIVAGVERVVVLRDGRIAYDGATAEVVTSDRMSDLFGAPVVVEPHDRGYRLG